MKRHVKQLTVILIASLGFAAQAELWAQEWSAIQQEVWKSTESFWDALRSRDLDKAMAYIHDDYLGWDSRDPLPTTKADVRHRLQHSFKTTQIVVLIVKPVGIKVHGDFAIVHYYYQRVAKDSEGKETSTTGRFSDILRKQGERWLLIADHGGPERDVKD